MAQGFAALDPPSRAFRGHGLRLVVTAREPAAEGVLLLTLADPDGAQLPAWQPGRSSGTRAALRPDPALLIVRAAGRV